MHPADFYPDATDAVAGGGSPDPAPSLPLSTVHRPYAPPSPQETTSMTTLTELAQAGESGDPVTISRRQLAALMDVYQGARRLTGWSKVHDLPRDGHYRTGELFAALDAVAKHA